MTFFQRSLALLLLFSFPLGALADPEIIENQETSLVYPPFWHTPFGIHRATPKLLAWFVGNRTTFQQPQDLACNLLLEDVAAGAREPEFRISVLGVNSGAGNLIYNPDFTHLEVMGDQPASGPLFRMPMGAALSANGIALVTDPGLGQVLRLKFHRKKLLPDGLLPPPPNGWQKPWGVAMDSQGRAYVTDSGCHRIFIYSPEGVLLRSLGPELSPGFCLTAPQAIAVADPQERWSFYRGRGLYVCDQQGTRLLHMDDSGSVKQALRSQDLAPAGAPPVFAWLALDYYENLWVTDSQNNRIWKFNRDLEFLTTYGQPGVGDGCFQGISGIAIHRHFGQVLVAEKEGAHYFWIGADILNAKAERLLGRSVVTVNFFLTEPSRLTIWAEDPHTRRPELRFQTPWMDSGQHGLALPLFYLWEQSAFVLVLQAEATYSSATYKAKRVRLSIPALGQPN